MSFPRVNSIGWATDEVLKSTQMNTLDIDHTNAVDRRAGHLEIDSQDFITWNDQRPLNDGVASPVNFTLQGGTTTTAPYWRQSTVSTAGTIIFDVGPRANGTLKSVQIFCTGAANGTGHTLFPTTLPIFALSSYAKNNFTAALVLGNAGAVSTGNFGDGPTNFGGVIANYNAVWSVTLSNAGTGFGDLSHESNKGAVVNITGETGTNSVANAFAILGMKFTWTCVAIRPGG